MGATGAGPDSRTFKCLAGKLAKDSFEATLRNEAEFIGLTCTIDEKPHLFSTDVVFTVAGPADKLDEFERFAKKKLRAQVILSTGRR